MLGIFEQIIDHIADKGYAIVDGFLEPVQVAALRDRLRERQAEGELARAGVGQDATYTKDRSIRGDYICWLEKAAAGPVELSFLQRIEHFITYLNRTCFTALNDYEFHYALYPAGSFYRRHLDQFKQDQSRVFSLICYLNADWQPADGGELVLYLPEGPLHVAPLAGRIVCFRSEAIEHEVLEAHRERLSITGWLRSQFLH